MNVWISPKGSHYHLKDCKMVNTSNVPELNDYYEVDSGVINDLKHHPEFELWINNRRYRACSCIHPQSRKFKEGESDLKIGPLTVTPEGLRYLSTHPDPSEVSSVIATVKTAGSPTFTELLTLVGKDNLLAIGQVLAKGYIAPQSRALSPIHTKRTGQTIAAFIEGYTARQH